MRPFASFPCVCGAKKLRRRETRHVGQGVKERLFECESCGQAMVTQERVLGPTAKRSIPARVAEARA